MIVIIGCGARKRLTPAARAASQKSEAALHGSCATAVDAGLEAKNAPAGDPPDGAVVLPEGQRLDGPLAQAIVDALPDGTMFGFNSDAGVGVRTWMCVIGPVAVPTPPLPARCWC